MKTTKRIAKMVLRNHREVFKAVIKNDCIIDEISMTQTGGTIRCFNEHYGRLIITNERYAHGDTCAISGPDMVRDRIVVVKHGDNIHTRIEAPDECAKTQLETLAIYTKIVSSLGGVV